MVAIAGLVTLAIVCVILLVVPGADPIETQPTAAAGAGDAVGSLESAGAVPVIAAFEDSGLPAPSPTELQAIEQQCADIAADGASVIGRIADQSSADQRLLQRQFEIVCPESADILAAARATDATADVGGLARIDGGGRTNPQRGARETGNVTRIVDGDTVEVAGHGTIRLIGIDTPEQGECGYDKASRALSALALGKTATLVPGARDDRDRYGRLLRYLDVGATDAGLELIDRGLAIARYDSRDGYGSHPREGSYVATDSSSDARNRGPCPPVLLPPTTADNGTEGRGEPWNRPGPDLDCADIGQSVMITGPDYHRLDADGDGIGCESYS